MNVSLQVWRTSRSWHEPNLPKQLRKLLPPETPAAGATLPPKPSTLNPNSRNLNPNPNPGTSRFSRTPPSRAEQGHLAELVGYGGSFQNRDDRKHIVPPGVEGGGGGCEGKVRRGSGLSSSSEEDDRAERLRQHLGFLPQLELQHFSHPELQ